VTAGIAWLESLPPQFRCIGEGLPAPVARSHDGELESQIENDMAGDDGHPPQGAWLNAGGDGILMTKWVDACAVSDVDAEDVIRFGNGAAPLSTAVHRMTPSNVPGTRADSTTSG